MSLVCWLPLNGDLRNQGTSDLIFTAASTNTTMNTSGKIGACYTNNSHSAGGLISDKPILLGTQYSMCCWFKFTDLEASASLGGGLISQHRYSKNTGFGLTIRYVSSTTGYLSVNTGTGSSRTYKTYYGTTLLQANTWYHACGTYDGTNIKIYLNGVLEKTQAYTMSAPEDYLTIFCWSLSGNSGATIHGDYKLNGALNDIRIYDHCLSAAEVREISQGLVLHYKLNDAIGFTDLIARGTTWTIYNNHNNTNMPSTLVDTGNMYNGDKVYRETCTPTDNSINSIRTSLGSHGVYNWRRTFTANTKYVFWIYYKPISHSDTRCGGTASNIGGWTEIPPVEVGGGWYRVGAYRSGTVTTDKTDNIFVSFKVPSATVGNPIIIDWASPHLLEGTTEIPPYDYPSTIIQDNSGYNHNGTITGTISIDFGSPRYQSSVYVNGSSYILTPAGSFAWNDLTQLTFSAWMKPTASMTGWRGSVGIAADSNQTARGIAITDYGNEFRGTYTNGSGYVTVATGKTLTQNEWHHCAGTLNGTEFKLYFDGALVKTQTIDWGTATLNANARFEVGVDLPGTDEKFTGNYSDVRCYCTALDADAIRQLYEVGAKVDNKNNVHSFELNEDGKNEITKAGQLKSDLISEFGNMSYLKYDNKIYIEPDGSCWARIYHHNNPGAGSFSSSNDFAHSVYIDENRWFNVELCNYLDKWELMVKGKFTSTSNEWKLRWIQNVNPMTAAYADVAVANITKITTDGYSSSPSSWGGLYAKKSSAYLTANNGNSGNWWGAVGSYSVYQKGIPGWGPTTTVTTTGFNDLYVRIDNVNFSSAIVKISKNNIWTAAEFIEL